MKPYALPFLLTLCLLGQAVAQNDKNELAETIAAKHSWLPSVLVQTFVTTNLSNEFWDKLMKETDRPMGVKTLNRTGMAIAEYLDNTAGTTLNKMCGLGVNGTTLNSNKPLCDDQIRENRGKLSITLNSGKTRLTEDSYKLLFVMLTTVNEFLNGSKYMQSTGKGWKPKAKTLAITINSGTKEADLGARWNSDFSAVTITTSPYVEVPGWSDKITRTLLQGATQ
ncbi:hypothetical protein FAES_2509 [Fibrella aestuarina BUZ 2]|uniref:Uncharacterized protein n=1 Tax=Fibrella aestuarina BUZ 2 TaxID=1166018 RepID=I0K8R5_9BACT|nr:hypothetical protein [Fibrella aestuarina]CCH00518.1 hypothetical protein FAES_2509 [Fibrella aestuarina BUZ 2]